jgi:hypothetical protein
MAYKGLGNKTPFFQSIWGSASRSCGRNEQLWTKHGFIGNWTSLGRNVAIADLDPVGVSSPAFWKMGPPWSRRVR